MKPMAKITSLILCIVTVISCVSLTGCKDSRYGDYDSEGERYDYYLPDYVDVCDYKGIKVPDLTYTATKEDVDNAVNSRAVSFLPYTPDPDRACEYGDLVDIITTCVFEGTDTIYRRLTFEGEEVGEDKEIFGQTFLLGARVFGVPELDEAVRGMKQGETKKVTISLPDPYYYDYLYSGAKLEMEIYLNYIDEVDYSNMKTDSFFPQNFSLSEAQFRQNIENELNIDFNEKIENYKAELSWDYIVANSKLKEIPEKEYKEIYDNKYDTTRAEAEEAGMTLSEYVTQELGYESLDKYKKYVKNFAESKCYEEMLLYYVIRCEGLECTDAFYEETLLKMGEEYELTDVSQIEDFFDYYYGIETVREQLELMYAQHWIGEQTKVVENVTTVNNKLNK